MVQTDFTVNMYRLFINCHRLGIATIVHWVWNLHDSVLHVGVTFMLQYFFMGNKYGKCFIAFNMKYECTNQCTILCIFIESKLWSPRFKRFFCDNYNYAAIKMSDIEKLFNFYLILQKKLFFNDKCMLKTVIIHKKPIEKYQVQTSN